MMKTIAAALTALALTGMAGAAFAEGDAEAGAKIFKKCKACHKVGDSAKNGVGPMLNGIVGNEIASVEGFEKKYSKAFMAKKDEGLIWTEEVLDAYLTKPKKYIKGTKMTFPGLKKEADRANVIAYLLSFE